MKIVEELLSTPSGLAPTSDSDICIVRRHFAMQACAKRDESRRDFGRTTYDILLIGRRISGEERGENYTRAVEEDLQSAGFERGANWKVLDRDGMEEKGGRNMRLR